MVTTTGQIYRHENSRFCLPAENKIESIIFIRTTC